MIKASGRTGDGRPLAILGLSGENVTRLMAGEPMVLELRELGLPDVQVLLVGGRTEGDITAALYAVGWSQLALAVRLGVSQTSVSYWESGQRAMTAADLVRVADALEVPPASLLPADKGRPRGRFRLPLRTGRRRPHQTIYDADDVMVATGMTPESAAWIVAVANQGGERG